MWLVWGRLPRAIQIHVQIKLTEHWAREKGAAMVLILAGRHRRFYLLSIRITNGHSRFCCWKTVARLANVAALSGCHRLSHSKFFYVYYILFINFPAPMLRYNGSGLSCFCI